MQISHTQNAPKKLDVERRTLYSANATLLADTALYAHMRSKYDVFSTEVRFGTHCLSVDPQIWRNFVFWSFGTGPPESDHRAKDSLDEKGKTWCAEKIHIEALWSATDIRPHGGELVESPRPSFWTEKEATTCSVFFSSFLIPMIQMFFHNSVPLCILLRSSFFRSSHMLTSFCFMSSVLLLLLLLLPVLPQSPWRSTTWPRC